MKTLLNLAVVAALAGSQVALIKYGSVPGLIGCLAAALLLFLASSRIGRTPKVMSTVMPGESAGAPPGIEAPAVATEPARSGGDYVLWLLRAVLALGALYLAWKGQRALRDIGSRWDGFVDYLYAGGLLFLACFRIEKQEEQPQEKTRWRIPLPLEIFLFTAVFGVGVFFRLYQIDSIPPGCWFDEALHGNLTKQLIAMKGHYPVFCADDREPSLALFIQALWFKLAGVNVLALRLTPASIGILMLPFFYFFLRSAMNVPAALAGTFLLAVGRWHVNFSRVNFVTGILAPFVVTATLYFYWRAFKSGRWRDYLLGGVLLGTGTHTYQPAWFMPFVLFMVFLLRSALVPGYFRSFFGKFFVSGVVSFVVFAPMAYYFWTHPGIMTFRSREVTIFKQAPQRGLWEIVKPAWWKERWPIWKPNLLTTAYMYNKDGDTNGRHNLPGWPVLEDWTGVLFGLGLLFTSWDLLFSVLGGLLDVLARVLGRAPPRLVPITPMRMFGILLWVTFWVMILPASVTIEAPQALRTIVAIPAVFALAGLALFRVWQAVEGVLPGVWVLRAVPALAVGAALYGIGQHNFTEYFKIQANHRAVWSAYSPIDHGIGEYVKTIDDRYEIYSDHISHPTIEFVAGHNPPYHYILPIPIDYLPIKEEAPKDVVYILLPFFKAYLPLLQAWYPGGQFKDFDHTFPDGTMEPMFFVYTVSRDEVNRNRGLLGHYYAPGSVSATVHPDPKVAFEKGGDHELARSTRAEWTGVFFVAGTAEYVLGTDSTGPAQVRVDGETIVTSGGGRVFSKKRILVKGLHPIVVTAHGGRGSGMTLLFGPDEKSAREVGPTNLHPITIPASGLAGRYFQNLDWSGRPTFDWVDSKINFHPNANPIDPWSAEWVGTLTCPRDGKYVFGLDSAEDGFLWIDGKSAAENRTNNRGQYSEGTVDLKVGPHAIRVRFKQSYCDLYWTPPQGVRGIVPSEALHWNPADLQWHETSPSAPATPIH